MAAGTERPNLETDAARRHSLHRKVGRRIHGVTHWLWAKYGAGIEKNLGGRKVQ